MQRAANQQAHRRNLQETSRPIPATLELRSGDPVAKSGPRGASSAAQPIQTPSMVAPVRTFSDA